MLVNPIVTVLMSVYNGERYLNEAIDSILAQTFTDFEFLIIDDASTDSTPKILHSYDDPRIRIVTNEENLGLTKSLNKGLALAQGEYIARMDADDISLPERLMMQLNFLIDNKTVPLVGSGAIMIDEDGKSIGKMNLPILAEDNYTHLQFINCFVHSSVFFKRSVILSYGGYNECFFKAQDYALWHHLSKKNNLMQLPNTLIKYRTKYHNDRNQIINQDKTWNQVIKNNIKELISVKLNNFEVELFLAPFNKRYFGTATMASKQDVLKILNIVKNYNIQIVNNSNSNLDKGKVKTLSSMFFRAYLVYYYNKIGLISSIKFLCRMEKGSLMNIPYLLFIFFIKNRKYF